jgi:hypothetical protein
VMTALSKSETITHSGGHIKIMVDILELIRT